MNKFRASEESESSCYLRIKCSEMIPVSIHDVLNTQFSTRSLMLAHKVESKLKYNTGSDLTPASRKVIVRVIKRCSQKRVPVSQIGALMTLLFNGKYKNVAIAYLLTKLFYLRDYRIIFRLIKDPNFKNFMDLIVIADNDTRDMLNSAEIAKIKDRKTFMTFMFALKGRTTVSEMFALQSVKKYYKNHHAGLNPHYEYRCWW